VREATGLTRFFVFLMRLAICLFKEGD
jgi:hypothetical protein